MQMDGVGVHGGCVVGTGSAGFGGGGGGRFWMVADCRGGSSDMIGYQYVDIVGRVDYQNATNQLLTLHCPQLLWLKVAIAIRVIKHASACLTLNVPFLSTLCPVVGMVASQISICFRISSRIPCT